MKEVNAVEHFDSEKVFNSHVENLISEVGIEDEKEIPEQNLDSSEKESNDNIDSENSEADSDEQKNDEKKEDKKVSLAALHEEREKRRALKARLEEMEKTHLKLEGSVKELLSKMHPGQEENVPSIDEDPLAAIEYQNKKLSERIAQLEEAKKNNDEALRANDEFKDFITKYQSQAKEFAETKKDFKDAYNFLIEGRKNELRACGYSEKEIIAELVNTERDIVQRAFNDEANAAERIYNLAITKGFTNASKEKNNGKKSLDTIDSGIRASRSLNGGTSEPSKDLSLDALSARDISAMSDAEFNALVRKYTPR